MEEHGALKQPEGLVGQERLDCTHAVVENFLASARQPLFALFNHGLVENVHGIFSLVNTQKLTSEETKLLGNSRLFLNSVRKLFWPLQHGFHLLQSHNVPATA